MAGLRQEEKSLMMNITIVSDKFKNSKVKI